ncbi:MAG: hypothetical protein WCP45_18020, partial [Verrucomicrobiota bacterium]
NWVFSDKCLGACPEDLYCLFIDPAIVARRPRLQPIDICPSAASIACKLEGPEKTPGYQPIRPIALRMAWKAAPAVSGQFAFIASSQPGSRRIEMDVIRHDFEIMGIAVRGIDRNRLVTPLENMPAPHPPPVPTLAEGSQQEFHPANQIRFRCFHQQMEMIAHENPGMHPPAMTFADLPKSEQKPFPVFVRFKNHLAAVTTRH